MVKESQPKHRYPTRNSSKSKKSKKTDTQEEEVLKKRKDESSDEDDDDDDSEWLSEDENDDDEDDDYSHDDLDMKEYRNFLAKMFPSNYATQRARDTPPSKHKRSRKARSPVNNDEICTRAVKRRKHKIRSSDDDEPSENIVIKTTEKRKRSSKKSEKHIEETAESEEEDESDDDDDEIDLEDEDLIEMDENGKPTNFTIHFTIGGQEGEMEDGELDESENEESCDEDDEDDEDDSEVIENTKGNQNAVEELRKMIHDYSLQRKNGEEEPSIIKKMRNDLEKAEKKMKRDGEKQLKKAKIANTKKFNSMLKEKNMMNDVKFFREKMTVDEQSKVLSEMDEILKHCRIEKPYRLQLLDADIPPEYKAVAYKKIESLKYLEPGAGEFYKIKQWVDTFMQIPFGQYKNLPVTLKDNGPGECADFMDNAKTILDGAVYGMNDVKLQIMQMVGQWITNPNAMGTAIAIKGPMGTGKTTLVKEGISKVLGRDFSFMALGGATDSSFLEGHSYTYEGSTWGKIIDNLVQCKSMNPVIFFDELDKISDTPKGEEIVGILTHLTDTTQNSKFHDKYFAELDFDLSRCLFIFSYNDENKVNPILRDRMYRVETKGYESKEKIVIANDYLLPKIREQVMFNADEIIIPDDTMKYIISTHTEGEQGVRNLKRCLEIIYTKLNLYRLMRPGVNLFEKEMALEVSFPMTITNEIVDKLIKKSKDEGVWRNLYI
jgi:ATP-dependent Lon protease